MDASLLETLALALGVEPDIEIVLARLEELKETLTADAPDGAMADEMIEEEEIIAEGSKAEKLLSSLKEALGVKSLAAVLQKLDDFAATARRSLVRVDTNAMQQFNTAYQQSALEAAPQDKPTPRKTVDTQARRSRSLNAPAVTGTATAPALGQMVKDLFGPRTPLATRAAKAASYQTGPGGGYVVEETISREVIAALKPEVVALQSGMRQVPISGTGRITWPKQMNRLTGASVAEGQQIARQNIQWGVVEMRPVYLKALVAMPAELLDMAAIDIDGFVREQLQEELALQMDYQVLFGNGGGATATTGAQVTGLLNTTGVTNTALGSGNGDRPTLNDLIDAIGRVEDANVNLQNGAWVMAPRSARTLMSLTDLDGNPLLKQNWRDNITNTETVLGFQPYKTTQVPINVTVGTSTDTSYIFFGNMRNALVGIGQSIEIMSDDGMQYFDEDIVQIKARLSFGFAVEYPEAFQVLSGVRP